MEKLVDVAVIGAGTAGINALAEIRKVTEDIALIDSGPLSTTCARVGCMPFKIMIQVGDDYHRRQVLGEEGIDRADGHGIDVAQSMAHVRELRDAFVAASSTILSNHWGTGSSKERRSLSSRRCSGSAG